MSDPICECTSSNYSLGCSAFNMSKKNWAYKMHYKWHIREVLSKIQHQCSNCGCDLTFNTEKATTQHYATIDHTLPVKKGYPLSIYNTTFMCGKCNSYKGHKTATRKVLCTQAAIAKKINRATDLLVAFEMDQILDLKCVEFTPVERVKPKQKRRVNMEY